MGLVLLGLLTSASKDKDTPRWLDLKMVLPLTSYL